MEITGMHYLAVASLLFGLGLYGVFTRRNAVALLLAVELMMIAVALNFAAATGFFGHSAGQVFAVFVITVAAAEAAVGLAIVLALFQTSRNIDVRQADLLRE